MFTSLFNLKTLFFVIIIIPLSVFSQEIDSVRRPDIFASQVEMFKHMQLDTRSVVFLGNSITFWGNWPERLQNLHVKNRGIPGDNTYGVLERLDNVLTGRPEFIFLMIGVNDLAQGFSDQLILQNIGKIVSRIRTESPETQLVIQSFLPVNPTLGKLSNHTQHVRRIPILNQALKKMAEAKGAQYLDLYPQFVDAAGYLRIDLTWDGVHLTEPGYFLWGEILKKSYKL